MADNKIEFEQIYSNIRIIKSAADELKRLSGSFPALNRNTQRILASLKMLEMNISDLVDLDTN
jgi:hypothetical protein